MVLTHKNDRETYENPESSGNSSRLNFNRGPRGLLGSPSPKGDTGAKGDTGDHGAPLFFSLNTVNSSCIFAGSLFFV